MARNGVDHTSVSDREFGCWAPRMYESWLKTISIIATALVAALAVRAQSAEKPMPEAGELIYQANMASAKSVSGWVMEGPGRVEFKDGWMHMFSPQEAMHHVFWCPNFFPDSFIARWEAQNLEPDAGLVIVFFAARGADGEDIFDPALPVRDGTFTQYTEGRIKSYHISYYANAAHNPSRAHANLRKNNTFTLLQEGKLGIPAESTAPHIVTLVKQGPWIRMYIDDRKIIDYKDTTPTIDGKATGSALGEGKIGFRQMKWTHFRYRNFRVYRLANSDHG